MIDIAREAGTSPATFYQYFPDVEAAILVLAEEMALDGERLVAHRAPRATGRARPATPTALELADAFLEFWEQHRPVLRVVDLATDEGDRRFRNIRIRLLNDGHQRAGRRHRALQRRRQAAAGVDPMATAGVLVAMLAHVAAHRYGFEFWGIRTTDVRISVARQVYWGATGQRPPA